ncbi:ATP-binding cassette domain-containing protein [Chitinophaga oryzae]|uniref:ATP-binding cassette domain-containing protein n=1 Tax=Chitinophaga oryzae TaxID=2725414 RepID=A0ABX6LGP4_9BACT|nr:ATP-binding cassette domain-containing protein [Chitinophaga oryzae]QJB39294.1 ATP-binding cassette domain-containing protein [Chitinophaga oryzae]
MAGKGTYLEMLKVLQGRSKYFLPLLLILGGSNVVWNAGLLMLINKVLNRETLPYFGGQSWPLFIGLLVLSYWVSRLFQRYLIRISNELAFEYEMKLFNSLRSSSYENIMTLGTEKIYALMEDTQVVSEFPQHFIQLVNSAIIVAIGIIYLFTISVPAAALVLGVMLLLAALYFYKNIRIVQYLNETRSLSDSYHVSIRDLLNGFKEVKMSSRRNDNLYFKHLNKNRLVAKTLNYKILQGWLNNDLLGRYSWFLIIGVILYLLPSMFGMQTENITTFVVTLLFLSGPIGELIAFIPHYSRVAMAIGRLKVFDETIRHTHTSIMMKMHDDGGGAELAGSFSDIRLDNILYYHQQEDNNVFTVKLDHLTIRKGELVFVTGGNGSGKTTFINILAGLVQPREGDVSYNGIPVTEDLSQHYRNKFAVIFGDNHLFTENYDDAKISRENPQLMDLIEQMKLTDIIVINEERNKLETELSKAQRKRLAMIYALLEQKEILILDEWASDQDSHFKSYFYLQYLGRLKAMGKTIIAVTHDDLFFDCADRVIRFDYGRILYDRKVDRVALT